MLMMLKTQDSNGFDIIGNFQGNQTNFNQVFEFDFEKLNN